MLITSGLMANVCCIAMLIIPQHKENNNKKEHADTRNINADENCKQTADHNEETFYKGVSHKFRSLCYNRDFILACIAIAMLYFSTSAGFTHVIAYAELEGLNSTWSSVVVTMAGLGSFGT